MPAVASVLKAAVVAICKGVVVAVAGPLGAAVVAVETLVGCRSWPTLSCSGSCRNASCGCRGRRTWSCT